MLLGKERPPKVRRNASATWMHCSFPEIWCIHTYIYIYINKYIYTYPIYIYICPTAQIRKKRIIAVLTRKPNERTSLFFNVQPLKAWDRRDNREAQAWKTNRILGKWTENCDICPVQSETETRNAITSLTCGEKRVRSQSKICCCRHATHILDLQEGWWKLFSCRCCSLPSALGCNDFQPDEPKKSNFNNLYTC